METKLPIGISSVVPLDVVINPQSTTEAYEAKVACNIAKYLLYESSNLKNINIPAISGTIRKISESDCTITNLEDLLLPFGMEVTSWVSSSEKKWTTLVSEISLFRLQKFSVRLIQKGKTFIVLGTSPNNIVIVNPHNCHPFTGQPHKISQNGCIINARNYLGITSHLTHYFGDNSINPKYKCYTIGLLTSTTPSNVTKINPMIESDIATKGSQNNYTIYTPEQDENLKETTKHVDPMEVENLEQEIIIENNDIKEEKDVKVEDEEKEEEEKEEKEEEENEKEEEEEVESPPPIKKRKQPIRKKRITRSRKKSKK